MTQLIYNIENAFSFLLEFSIIFIEFIGYLILIFSVLRAVGELLRHKNTVKLNLVEGIALSLEFKIGSELLHTVIVREWDEILFVGTVIALRALLAFLIQWEITLEKKNRN